MADRLTRYRTKRDFGSTAEPQGAPPEGATPEEGGAGTRFVVQEHHARRLHWDLRLERDGVLVSWAIPKGIPADPARNHLAVHTEDHPLEYPDFHGDIPKGEYGAGTMTIWDRGTYETHKFDEREVMVSLSGERAQGRYVLFRTDGDNWMIHRMDPPADPDRELMPERVAPMLATLARGLPPDGDRYRYEVKWDGVRAIAYVDGCRARFEGRRGTAITSTYPELRGLGEALGSVPAVLDGEIVAFDDGGGGRPSFERIQQRMHVSAERAVRRLMAEVPVAYVIFDLLWLDGHSTLALPYDDRRTLLERLALAGPAWQVPASYDDGDALLAATRAQGLEGVVAKRRDSVYSPGRRSRDWLKVKHHLAQELVVGGWLPGRGNRTDRVGALLVGYHDEDRLRYAGRVGTGFTDAELHRIEGLLRPLARATSPFDPAPRLRDAVYVEPRLVARVRFGEWTRAGVVRHPVYLGTVEDRPPADIVRERPV